MILRLVMDQTTQNIGRFIEYWTLDQVVNGRGREVTKAVQTSSMGKNYLCLNSKCFENYITKLRAGWNDFYITRFGKK